MDDESENPFLESVPSFTAKSTGYHPVEPSSPEYKMEGGKVGASEWHGEGINPAPLFTLDEYRAGEAPYVSVAMDNTHNNPLPYGTVLESDDEGLKDIPFVVMDTGSAFNGSDRKYGGPKGLSRIDIARDTAAGANSKETNKKIRFTLASDELLKRIEEFPKLAGETTREARAAATEISSDNPFAEAVPKAAEPAPELSPDNPFAEAVPEQAISGEGIEQPVTEPTPEPQKQEAEEPTPVAAPQAPTKMVPAQIPPSAQEQPIQPEAAPSPIQPGGYFFSKAGVTPQEAVEMSPAAQTPILGNAVAAAKEVGSDFIPKSLDDVVGMLTPAVDAPSEIFKGYNAVKGFVEGRPINQLAQELPESQIIKQAENTPAFSKERYKAGFQMAALLGTGVAFGRGAFPKERLEPGPLRWKEETPPIQAKPDIVPEHSELITQTNSVLDAAAHHNALVGEAAQLQQAAGQLQKVGIPVPKPVADRIAAINAEMQARTLPETETISVGVADRYLPVDMAQLPGISWQDTVNRGQAIIAKDPQAGMKVSQRILNQGLRTRLNYDDFCVIRAERENLAKDVQAGRNQLRKNPSSSQLQKQLKKTIQAEKDFLDNVLATAQNIWHREGEALQGERQIQVNSYDEVRRAISDIYHKDVDVENTPELKNLVDRVQAGEKELQDLTNQTFREVAKKLDKPGTVRMNMDQLRSHLAQRIKQLTPC